MNKSGSNRSPEGDPAVRGLPPPVPHDFSDARSRVKANVDRVVPGFSEMDLPVPTKKFRLEVNDYVTEAVGQEKVDAFFSAGKSVNGRLPFTLRFPDGSEVHGSFPLERMRNLTGVSDDEVKNTFLASVRADDELYVYPIARMATLKRCPLVHYLEARVDFVGVEDEVVRVTADVLPSGAYRLPRRFMEKLVWLHGNGAA